MTTADVLVSEPLRVLIADDHALFRDGLRAPLRSAPDTQLVAEATTGVTFDFRLH
jgi:two-component system, NarL family, nitrate/nitrite response regulator NarL